MSEGTISLYKNQTVYNGNIHVPSFDNGNKRDCINMFYWASPVCSNSFLNVSIVTSDNVLYDGILYGV